MFLKDMIEVAHKIDSKANLKKKEINYGKSKVILQQEGDDKQRVHFHHLRSLK